MSPQKPERLLTVAQAAALLQVHPQTLREWCRAGKVPSIRTAGGHRRFVPSKMRALRDKGFPQEGGAS